MSISKEVVTFLYPSQDEAMEARERFQILASDFSERTPEDQEEVYERLDIEADEFDGLWAFGELEVGQCAQMVVHTQGVKVHRDDLWGFGISYWA